MHPILTSALEPLAVEVRVLSLDEAQVIPLPGQDRWSPQQVLEHLILTYKMTSDSVSQQLKGGRVPRNGRNSLKFLLRMQTIMLGHMPNGVPSMRRARPLQFVPEDGPGIARRFSAAAEEMDQLLVAARKRFGMEACGEHPFYGAMRVDEWRRYHAVHARHHLPQLKKAIRYARELHTARTAAGGGLEMVSAARTALRVERLPSA